MLRDETSRGGCTPTFLVHSFSDGTFPKGTSVLVDAAPYQPAQRPATDGSTWRHSLWCLVTNVTKLAQRLVRGTRQSLRCSHATKSATCICMPHRTWNIQRTALGACQEMQEQGSKKSRHVMASRGGRKGQGRDVNRVVGSCATAALLPCHHTTATPVPGPPVTTANVMRHIELTRSGGRRIDEYEGGHI